MPIGEELVQTQEEQYNQNRVTAQGLKAWENYFENQQKQSDQNLQRGKDEGVDTENNIYNDPHFRGNLKQDVSSILPEPTPIGPADNEITHMSDFMPFPFNMAPAVGNVAKGALESLGTLPERAIKAAGNQTLTEGDPSGKQGVTAAALETSMNMMGAGTAFVPKGSLGVMGGGNAVKWGSKEGKQELMLAHDMMKQGYTPEQVFDATGIFVGADNRIRFEIPDTYAKLKGYDPNFQGFPVAQRGTYLPEILDHPELFKQYPDLKAVRVAHAENIKEGGAGYFDVTDVIVLGRNPSEGDMRQAVLHEIQHAVQKREGFARGANINTVRKAAYQKSAGEVEAQNVEYRSRDTQASKWPENRFPWATEDIPIADQIVNFN